MTRPTIKLGNKSVADKIIEQNLADQSTSTEVIAKEEFQPINQREISLLQEKEAMQRFNLVKAKKGSRVDIDEDLHREFKIAAIRRGKTQKDWLEEIIREAVLKANKKFEK